MAQIAQIEFWLLDQTDEDLAGKVLDLLSDAEHCRAAAFSDRRCRIAFTVRRGMLRALVARSLGSPPESVLVQTTPTGKPYIPIAGAPNIGLSHSGSLAIVALCATHSVGVDIETLRGQDDLSELANRYFSTEERRLLGFLAEGDAASFDLAFLQVWTMKEAYLKALGQGVDRLQEFTLTLGDAEARSVVVSTKLDDDPYNAWSVTSQLLPGGVALAFAAPAPEIGLLWRNPEFQASGPVLGLRI